MRVAGLPSHSSWFHHPDTYHEALSCAILSSLLLFPPYLFIYIQINPKRLENLLDIEQI